MVDELGAVVMSEQQTDGQHMRHARSDPRFDRPVEHRLTVGIEPGEPTVGMTRRPGGIEEPVRLIGQPSTMGGAVKHDVTHRVPASATRAITGVATVAGNGRWNGLFQRRPSRIFQPMVKASATMPHPANTSIR